MEKDTGISDPLEACRFGPWSWLIYVPAGIGIVLFFVRIDDVIVSDILMQQAEGTWLASAVNLLIHCSIAALGLAIALAPIQVFLAIFRSPVR